MRAFSQFQYCPLAWMFHSKKLNNNINKLHECTLRITYRGPKPSFGSLLEKDSSTTIHIKNLKVMLTEMFKTKIIKTPISWGKFSPLRNNSYNLRYNNEFLQPKVKMVSYALETIHVRGPQLWQTLPSHIKSSTSLKDFKRKIIAIYVDPIYHGWVVITYVFSLVLLVVLSNLLWSYSLRFSTFRCWLRLASLYFILL